MRPPLLLLKIEPNFQNLYQNRPVRRRKGGVPKLMSDLGAITHTLLVNQSCVAWLSSSPYIYDSWGMKEHLPQSFGKENEDRYGPIFFFKI